MIVDTNIQALPMLSHTQADGSNIGGVPPASYGLQLVPGKHRSLLMWTQGNTGKPTDYPAWMAYPATPRPILPNTGKLRVEMEYALGGNLAGLNAVETDVLIVMNGLKFNRSFQYVQGIGFEIADVNGNWLPTGINPGSLVANKRYSVAFDNVFDAKTSSTTSFERDGVVYFVPVSLQMVPAKPTNWKPDGVYVQMQMSSLPNGLPWSLKLKLNIAWT
jgi:hypothetical protein